MPFDPRSVPDVAENFDFGGVDSRSNPLNMPLNRAVRNENWIPMQGGWLRLRFGYSHIEAGDVTNPDSLTPPTNLAVHSLDFFVSWDKGTHYALIGQDHAITRMNMSDLTRVLVANLASGAKWNTYRANNKLYLGNGTDMIWYDGDKWRPIGLQPFDPSLFAAVNVTQGMRALRSGEVAAVTVTQTPAGGTFPTAATGIQFYVSQFDGLCNDLGPAVAVGALQTSTPGLDPSYTLAGLANWTTDPGFIQSLISVTPDGQDNSFFLASQVITGCSATRSATGRVVYTIPTGSISPDDIVLGEGFVDSFGNVDNAFQGPFFALTTGTGTFRIQLSDVVYPVAKTVTGGTIYVLQRVGNTGGSITITDPTVDPVFIANKGIGIAASTVVTDNMGYQIYASPYRTNAGGHVGNRIPIGNRVILTDAATIRINNLPDIKAIDPELDALIGRTQDGAQIPYACIDPNGNWITEDGPGNPAFNSLSIIRWSNCDFNSELPYRNGVPPGMDKFCRVERVYGNQPNSPYIFKFASEADQTTGAFVGVAAESCDPGDIETFPTAEAVTCLVDYDSDAWVFSRNNLAILDESAGYVNWQGPYPTGCAGQRAFVKTDHGPYWVSGKRQLCTRGETGPLPISDEYEAALLARIGPAFLSATELGYVNDPTKGLDYISIKAQDSSGNPFEVIHDFKLRDDRSPYGQGYVRTFASTLATNFCLKIVEDSDFVPQLWAGGVDGELYQLESAFNDNGVEFGADRIMLLYFGPDNQSVASLQIQGDNQLQLSWLNRLDKTIAEMNPLNLGPRPGNEPSFLYNANIKNGEAKNIYLRFQMTSHSADAATSLLNGQELNDPPHLPLEVYGSIYVARVESSTARGV